MRRNNQFGLPQNYTYSYYPETNRLRNTTGTTDNNYLYDAAGNVTANTERNISNITYDYRNLTRHISTNNGLHQYTYNAEGLRIGKHFSPEGSDEWTVSTRYVYGAYGELIAQFGGGTVDYWNIRRRADKVSGPNGETIGRKGLMVPPAGIGDIISIESGTYTGYNRFYYLKDHPPAGGQAPGFVRVTLNQNGSVVGHDDFYPFGLKMPGRSNNSANRDDDQKFTGHFFEQEGDLEIYHAQARMYDPAIGRFLGVDAMRSLYPGWSTYVYAMNNPVLLIDTTGNCAESGMQNADEDSDVDCIAPESDDVIVTADRETGERRVMSIPEFVSKVGYFIYEGSDGKERAFYNPNHPQGAMWLYNNLMQTNQGCEYVGAAGLSQQSQQIAMMACQHAGQAVFLRNFLAYTGLGVGIAGGAITFGGIAVGSYGLISLGGTVGLGASGINTVGHIRDGNVVGIAIEIGTFGVGRGFRAVNGARNLTSSERMYLNSNVFKTQSVGQFGSHAVGGNQ